MIFRLAAVVALLAIAEAGPRVLPGSATGGNFPSDRALLQPGTSASRAAGAAAMPRLQNFTRIPLSFEANQGQTDAQVQYLARGPGYTLFLTATEAVLALRSGGPAGDSSHSPVLPSSKRDRAEATHPAPEERAVRDGPAVLRMQLLGSNPAAEVQGTDRLRGIANYFLGNDPSQWRTQHPDLRPGAVPRRLPGHRPGLLRQPAAVGI